MQWIRSDTEMQERLRQNLEKSSQPYHAAIETWINAQSKPPVILSIHSFTKQLDGRAPRPWEIGVLSNHDRRLADPLIKAFAERLDTPIGDNEPYHGALKGDTIDQHALSRDLHHILLELRNDLIEDAAGQKKWAQLLSEVLTPTLHNIGAL